LESRDLSHDLVGVIDQLAGVVQNMETEFSYDDYDRDLTTQNLFDVIFKSFDEDLINQVSRLLNETHSDSIWTEQLRMLLTASRFNQYLIKRNEIDGYQNISFFEAEMGAEAVRKRLRTLDTFSLYKTLIKRIPRAAFDLMNQAFKTAYFFEYVDDAGFEALDLELPEGMLRPDQGEVWSE
jgi:hypothetical protein